MLKLKLVEVKSQTNIADRSICLGLFIHWTNNNKKTAISNGFCTSLDFVGLSFGGDEGDSIEQLSILNHYISF
jgi:hypothetical protein